MLKRKIEQQLLEWKNSVYKTPLVIKGCRQCGKTSSVRDFARKHYKHVVYINFQERQDFVDAFADSLEVDRITVLLSSMLGDEAVFKAGKTVLILDEIQDCPQARTALKFFHLDGRYDVIATGSLLGVKGYSVNPRSIPVGFETVLEMHPLDFEEFLWANGVKEEAIAMLADCMEAATPVPGALHNLLNKHLLTYAAVGGMPKVVQAFIDTHHMGTVLQLQRNIVESYEDDMVKHAERVDRSRIKECFQSIPFQLAKENKKFQYSKVRKGSTAAQYAGSIQWIEDAGIVSRCYNLSTPELPLDAYAERDCFKVYMADCGLFASMLEHGTQADILQGRLSAYKGAIFENLIADMFTKMGRKLYYYRQESSLEVDFVIRHKGKCTLVEVKATTGNTKSTNTVLANHSRYHVERAIKLGAYNIGKAQVGETGEILTLPLYMAFLLREY